MNLRAAIILAALLQALLVNLLSNVHDARTYRKSRRDTRSRPGCGFMASAYKLSFTLLFWLRVGLRYLGGLVCAWRFGPVTTGPLYIGMRRFSKAILGPLFRGRWKHQQASRSV